MATFFQLSNPLSLSHSHSHLFFFPLPHSTLIPPPLHLAAAHPFRRKLKGSTVAARAGPNTNSYIFAISIPLSLLAVTVFASLRIGDKLDQQFFEEMAKNEAIMEADEDDEDDGDDYDDDNNNNGDVEINVQEEPALPRARSRPKREA